MPITRHAWERQLVSYLPTDVSSESNIYSAARFHEQYLHTYQKRGDRQKPHPYEGWIVPTAKPHTNHADEGQTKRRELHPRAKTTIAGAARSQTREPNDNRGQAARLHQQGGYSPYSNALTTNKYLLANQGGEKNAPHNPQRGSKQRTESQ